MNDKKVKESTPEWLQVLAGIGQLYITAYQKINDFINTPEIKDGIIEVLKFRQKILIYTQQQKEQMKNMSQEGWFPSVVTFMTLAKSDENFDSYMERCLVDKLNQIEDLLYSKHPDRKLILEEAFRLFKEERYLAAIPLFISQLDGLSEDKDHSPFFSMDPKADWKKLKKLDKDDPKILKSASFPKVLRYALSNKIEGIDPKCIEFYREVIENAATSFISDRTPKVDLSDNKKILNRNGIMHGHKDFVGYGTRINALKVISLLLFVDHMLSLIESNENISDDE
jgi:hypothetical protein